MNEKIYAFLSTQALGLATFNGAPAIFEGDTPHDEADGWENGCYPHVSYVLDTEFDAERNKTGVLLMRVVTNAARPLVGGKTEDAQIAERLFALLHNTFTPVDGGTVSIQWESATPFFHPQRGRGESDEPEIFGVVQRTASFRRSNLVTIWVAAKKFGK